MVWEPVRLLILKTGFTHPVLPKQKNSFEGQALLGKLSFYH